jgi:hypothetical protein
MDLSDDLAGVSIVNEDQTTCSFCYTTLASLAVLLLSLPIPAAHTKIAISPTG